MRRRCSVFKLPEKLNMAWQVPKSSLRPANVLNAQPSLQPEQFRVVAAAAATKTQRSGI
jgi:hypothetical protein